MKILHTADLHFSKASDKLEESVRTCDYMLDVAEREKPDVIVIAGDSVDEHDGRILVDSEVSRAIIHFMRKAGDIAPVLVLIGTPSHDRKTPYLFKHLKTRYQIYVADKVEQVVLAGDTFHPLHPSIKCMPCATAIFTTIPSVDKSYFVGNNDCISHREGNSHVSELLTDVLSAFGIINEQQVCPRIFVGHGMVTGAKTSAGYTAVGEDLEFSIEALKTAKCDYYALGHVHKMQRFADNIYYSGSPGRLDFGETEDKGFLIAEFEGKNVKEVRFIKTPSRTFCLHELTIWKGQDDVLAEADKCKAICSGADVRFRYVIPEEERHLVKKDQLEEMFLTAGARKVKIEPIIVPITRQRSAGISRITSLPEKLIKWGDAVNEEVSEVALHLASIIESKSSDELYAHSLAEINDELIDEPKEEMRYAA